MTNLELNKSIVREYLEEVWNKKNPDSLEKYIALDYVRHCEAMPPPLQEIKGIEGLKQMYSMSVGAFPDWDEEIEILSAEGDKVAYLSRAKATQKGPFGPFPASGKCFTLTIIGIHRIADDKIAETWVTWDNVAWLTQLGHFPPPEGKR
jgi:steroid delta-isomerase-like uncharacterized protein